MTQVHQLVPHLNHGDAVGQHAMHLQETLRGSGFASEIFAQGCHEKVAHQCRHFEEHVDHASPDSLLVYHHCIGGTKVLPYFLRARCKKVVVYHNITPSRFFVGYSDQLVLDAELGRRELESLRGQVDYAVGDSEFNRRELEELGFERTAVIPIPFYAERFRDAQPARHVLDFYEDGAANIVFVGRIVPNKCQHDLIRVFAAYRRRTSRPARLFLVGSYAGMERYCNHLLGVMQELEVPNVILTGHTSFDELLAYYALADVFVSMSEHEGFCVPLLESMHFEVPILAYDSTGVTDTLGPAGVLLGDKATEKVLPHLEALVEDADLRERVIAAQRARLPHFDVRRIDAAWGALFTEVLRG